MRTLTGFTLLFGALALSGCASMSESQCRVADWGRVGYSDGAQGRSESVLADYAEDCGKIGIRPDAALYRQGWDQGILAFCTPQSGWREGVNGSYGKAQSCVGQAAAPAYESAFQAGLQVYRTQSRISANNSEIDRLQKKLLSSKDEEEKRRLRADLRRLDLDQILQRALLMQQQMSAPR